MTENTNPNLVPRRLSTVSLREVTRENLQDVLGLQVAPGQDRYVASNAVSIAQASFQRENSWFRAIYADDTPVGFLLIEEWPDEAKYHLWRFMIAQPYQRLGFGRQSLKLLLDHVRTRPGASEFLLSCVPGEGGPGPFYEKLGFAYTGEVDDGELIMRIVL